MFQVAAVAAAIAVAVAVACGEGEGKTAVQALRRRASVHGRQTRSGILGNYSLFDRRFCPRFHPLPNTAAIRDRVPAGRLPHSRLDHIPISTTSTHPTLPKNNYARCFSTCSSEEALSTITQPLEWWWGFKERAHTRIGIAHRPLKGP
jgi:hypothetical protein